MNACTVSKWLIVIGITLAVATPAHARSYGSSRSYHRSGTVSARPYLKRNGIFVGRSFRRSPNPTRFDNYSAKGNVNPFFGKKGYRNPL
jgi:hypothetical protein